MGKALFITGTGTDVGKTYVTGLIVRHLRQSGRNAGYYKAALSGAEPDDQGELQPGDAVYVNQMAEIGEKIPHLVSYVYREAVSPHLAARLNHTPIVFSCVEADFRWAREKYDYLTMEGSGGIICPLRWDDQQHVILDDLVKRLDLDALIVADAGLGTINAAVLTIEHLRARAIGIPGVIFNHYHPGNIMEEDNARMIEEITGIPVLAFVQDGDKELDMDPDRLAALYR